MPLDELPPRGDEDMPDPLELPAEDEPAELDPPRGAALLPDEEEPDDGRRASCAMTGVASASAITAVSESLTDACMAEPRALNNATLLPEETLQTTPIFRMFQA